MAGGDVSAAIELYYSQGMGDTSSAKPATAAPVITIPDTEDLDTNDVDWVRPPIKPRRDQLLPRNRAGFGGQFNASNCSASAWAFGLALALVYF